MRRQLWQQMVAIKGCIPWMTIGDFNCVLHYDEKKGRKIPSTIATEEFHKALDDYELSEVQYSGAWFTLCNNCQGRGSILSKIDRVFYNSEWELKFAEWRVKIMARVGSDHSLLFGHIVTVPKPSNNPFKFNVVWINHQSFMDIVRRSWSQEMGGPLC